MKKIFKSIYLVWIYIFLYAPILILVIFSFNDSKYATHWKGFTLKWYVRLFQHHALVEGLFNSLIIAGISSIAATLIGTLAAVAFYRYRFIGKKVLYALLYIVMMSPDIVMGISLLIFFMLIKVDIGFTTLLLSHITFCLPFVVVTVYARISGFDPYVIESSKDLGASEFQTFLYVILPMIMPAVISGWLLSFTLSLDDVIVSFFVINGSTYAFKAFALAVVVLIRLCVINEDAIFASIACL